MSEGKKLPISIVISAVDNVTYKVMAINEKIKRVTAPVGKVQQAFKTLGDEAGLGKLAKSMNHVGSTGKEFFGELAEKAAKVAAVGLAAAASIYEITKSFAEAGDEISTISQRLGISTDAFQELSYAAKKANVDQETFTGAMDKFSKGIGLAAAGTGDAFVGFNALGISVRDSTGHIRKMDDLLPEVADKLGAIKSEQLRAAVASKLFGKEGAKLNGIFKDGSKGLAEMRKEARDVGAVMTPEQIKTASEFDDGMKSVGATLLMVRNIIGAALAPVVGNLAKQLQAFILGNKDKIQAFAAAFAERLPRILDTLVGLFSTLFKVVSPMISLLGWLADTFGENTLMIAGLAAYFGPTILSFLKLSGAIWSFLGTAIRLGVVLAGLVGWPVLLAAGLIAAAVAIVKYWEPISKFFTDLWDKVGGFFGGKGMNLTTGGGAQLGAPAGFGKTVDAAQRSSSEKNENHVLVEFANVPQGTRTEVKKADGGLDLSMGFGLAAGVP